ncbi:MAG: Dna2/Cas4 domain-containing protein, partial [Methanobrevibacter sp.]|nr:Dna2/Cas4 domain-containing protein [Methanobrevibacter sp.]
NTLFRYLIQDELLGLYGSCDKIEIINGKYIPINISNKIPHLQGVFEEEALELVANALLIEQEFDTEVFVGYIEYWKTGERKHVIMDSKLRKSLFKVLHGMKKILEDGELPEDTYCEKCNDCEHYNVCITDEED